MKKIIFLLTLLIISFPLFSKNNSWEKVNADTRRIEVSSF
jgi:hypothetical protein